MSVLARIPAVVQRIVADDAVCEQIHLCSVGQEAVCIPTEAVKAASAQEKSNDGEWRLLYDVMKVDRQKVHFEDAHMERIMDSYRNVAKHALSDHEVAFTKDCLHRYIAELTTPQSPAQNLKYITWLPAEGDGEAPFTFVLYFIRSFFPPAEWYTTGTTLALLYNAHRENPNAKTVQAALRTRATDLQKSTGAFDVLLVHDAHDHYLIPEGSRSNYFLVSQEGTLLCSAEEDILVGITLRAARRAALRANLGAVHHQKLTIKELCEAKSLIMLGTSPGTLPVREVVLYHDEKGKEMFEAAARGSGVDLGGSLPNLQVTSKDPPKAVLTFGVDNPVVAALVKAYQEESLV